MNEVAEQETVLACEDALMLRRRLSQAKPVDVPALTAAQTGDLIERVRRTHRTVRGSVRDPAFAKFAREETANASPPRATVRATVERLESAWWNKPTE